MAQENRDSGYFRAVPYGHGKCPRPGDYRGTGALSLLDGYEPQTIDVANRATALPYASSSGLIDRRAASYLR